MAAGVHIAFRVLRYPDLTADGSVIIGGSVALIVLSAGLGPALSLTLGALAGGVLGLVTSVLSERLKVDRILAGLASTLLAYSITLRLMGSGNRSIPRGTSTLYGLPLPDVVTSGVVVAAVFVLLAIFVRSSVGLRLRATGQNPRLVSELGGNVPWRVSLGLFVANACVGLSGAMTAHLYRFADVGQGAGALFIGLACVLLGLAVPAGNRQVIALMASGIGAVAYSLIISVALRSGLAPGDLRGLTAILVVLTILITRRFLKSQPPPLFK